MNAEELRNLDMMDAEEQRVRNAAFGIGYIRKGDGLSHVFKDPVPIVKINLWPAIIVLVVLSPVIVWILSHAR